MEGVELLEICGCGNQFMPDAKFCRKCGAQRGSKENWYGDEQLNRWDLFIESNSGGLAGKPDEPHTLEIAYKHEGQISHEIVFEDPTESEKRPRLLVSLQSVLALKSLCEREFDRVEVITELLKCCRTAYYKELCYLREQLTLAMRPQGQAGLEEHIHDYEVYWYNPPEYLDGDMKAFLQDCIKLTNKKLIEENFELLQKLKALGDGKGAPEDTDTTIKRLIRTMGPGGLVRKIYLFISSKEYGGSEAKVEDFKKAVMELIKPKEDTEPKEDDENPHGDKAMLRKLRKELEELRKKEKEMEDLRRQIAQLQMNLDEMNKGKNSAAAMDKARADAETERANAEAARADKLAAEVDDLKRRLAELEALKKNIHQGADRIAGKLTTIASRMAPGSATSRGGSDPGDPLKRVDEVIRDVETALGKMLGAAKPEPSSGSSDADRQLIESLQKQLNEAAAREAKLKSEKERLERTLEQERKKKKSIADEAPVVVQEPVRDDKEERRLREEAEAMRLELEKLLKEKEELRLQLEKEQRQIQKLKEAYKEMVTKAKLEEAEAAADDLAQRLQRAQDKIYSLKDEVKKWKMLAGASGDDGSDSDESDYFGDIPKFLLSYVKRNRHSIKPRWQQLSEDARFARQKRDFLYGQRHGINMVEELGDAANAAFKFLKDQEEKEVNRRRSSIQGGLPTEHKDLSRKLKVRSRSIVLADERGPIEKALGLAQILTGRGGEGGQGDEASMVCQKCGTPYCLPDQYSPGRGRPIEPSLPPMSVVDPSAALVSAVAYVQGSPNPAPERKPQASYAPASVPPVSMVGFRDIPGVREPPTGSRSLLSGPGYGGDAQEDVRTQTPEKKGRFVVQAGVNPKMEVHEMPPMVMGLGPDAAAAVGAQVASRGRGSLPGVMGEIQVAVGLRQEANPMVVYERNQKSPQRGRSLASGGQATGSAQSPSHMSQAARRQASSSRSPSAPTATPTQQTVARAAVPSDIRGSGQRSRSPQKSTVSVLSTGNGQQTTGPSGAMVAAVSSSTGTWQSGARQGGPDGSSHTEQPRADVAPGLLHQLAAVGSHVPAKEPEAAINFSAESLAKFVEEQRGQDQRLQEQQHAQAQQLLGKRIGVAGMVQSGSSADSAPHPSGADSAPAAAVDGANAGGALRAESPGELHRRKMSAPYGPPQPYRVRATGLLPLEQPTEWAVESRRRSPTPTRVDMDMPVSTPAAAQRLRPHHAAGDSSHRSQSRSRPPSARSPAADHAAAAPPSSRSPTRDQPAGSTPVSMSRHQAAPGDPGEVKYGKSITELVSRTQHAPDEAYAMSFATAEEEDVLHELESSPMAGMASSKSFGTPSSDKAGSRFFSDASTRASESVTPIPTPHSTSQAKGSRTLMSNKTRTTDPLPMEASVDSVATITSTTAPSSTSRDSAGRSGGSGRDANSTFSSSKSNWRTAGSRKQPATRPDPSPPSPAMHTAAGIVTTGALRSPLHSTGGAGFGYGTLGESGLPGSRSLSHSASSPVSTAFSPPLGFGGAEGGRSPPARSATTQVRRSVTSPPQGVDAAGSPPKPRRTQTASGLRDRDAITWGHSRSAGALPLTNAAKGPAGGRGGSGSPVKRRSGSGPAGASLFTDSEAKAAVAAAGTEGVLPEVLPPLPPGKIQKGGRTPVTWLVA